MSAIHSSDRGGSSFCERTAARSFHEQLTRGLSACAIALVALGGCADRTRNAELQRFVPDAAAARGAVVAVFEEWKSGTSRNQNRGDSPHIEVVDNHRRPGRRILDYKVLGQTEFEGGRRLDTRVTWSDPEEVERIRFVVVGIDPLWVFRQEDYDMIAHWEHKMPAAATTDETEPAPARKPATDAEQEPSPGDD